MKQIKKLSSNKNKTEFIQYSSISGHIDPMRNAALLLKKATKYMEISFQLNTIQFTFAK